MSREKDALEGVVEMSRLPVGNLMAGHIKRIRAMGDLAAKGLEPEPEPLPDGESEAERITAYGAKQQDAVDRPSWAWAYNMHAQFLEACLEGDSQGLGGPGQWWAWMTLDEKLYNVIKPYVAQTQPGNPRYRTDGMWEGGNIPLESVRPFVEGEQP